MKKIFLSILMLSLMYNCDNNTVPSAEDTATFNKNVESWKGVVSGFSSQDPEKVMSIFAEYPLSNVAISTTTSPLTKTVTAFPFQPSP